MGYTNGEPAFDAVDDPNVQNIKAVMAQKAVEGDAAAASAYAALLNAETNRYQLQAQANAPEQEKPAPSTWQEVVRDGARSGAEMLTAA
jgi:hypothetical protein